MTDTTIDTSNLDRKARMKLPFVDLVARPVAERLSDFEPAYPYLTEEEARRAAERCIHCPEAPCQVACPVNNDISKALWLVEAGDFVGAARVYRQTSSLPEICGLVCPHESLCQGSCVRNKRGEPVLTGALEAFVTAYERAHAQVEIPKGPATRKRVAVVGTGPAGLACAEQLIPWGYEVTFFDALPYPGGLLTYGIPNFKLPKRVVDARLDDFHRAGARFETSTRIGKDRTVDGLLADGFDAVFLGVGSGIDSPMDVPGSDLPGVYQATEFLVRGNVDASRLPPGMPGRPDIGRRVAVVGGGDTASDCLRTALRLGAEEVTCLYRRTEAEMPGGKKDRELARQEGAKYRFLTQPVRFIPGGEGRVSAVECLQCELGEPDASGRRRPVPIEGSNFTVPAETVVLALGYWPDPLLGETTPGLETRKYGLIVADAETGTTSRKEVFAGGDAVTGPDLVVTAMRAGRRAAASIHAYLTR
ncbi:MAG TPA: NAD(P)-dependent oxidoreductase [Anaerolineales bacterium]|nr:NAD(P)-dependent oxidoreductase [Anaerolineales bacterium]